MAKPDTSAYASFGDVTTRLDQIIDVVRDKDTSLERSLDLFDEAIALGSRAVDLVDKVDFTPEERERLAQGVSEDAPDAFDSSSDASSQDDAPEAGKPGDEAVSQPDGSAEE